MEGSKKQAAIKGENKTKQDDTDKDEENASTRLTPTGKVSHAKTRVYAQRYRKEWEQMPDFKGWLTGVLGSDTRAYCLYCKKNLHAHRLSLLKHTCTMKHQRAALSHQNSSGEKYQDDDFEVSFGGDFEEDHSEEMQQEDVTSVQYVVERLEEQQIEYDQSNYEVMENEGSGDEVSYHVKESVAKRLKLEPQSPQDPLAKAMMAVHGMEDEEEPATVQYVIEHSEKDGEEDGSNSEDKQTEEERSEEAKSQKIILVEKLGLQKNPLQLQNITSLSNNKVILSNGSTITLGKNKMVLLNNLKGTSKEVQAKDSEKVVPSTSSQETAKTPTKMIKKPRISTHVLDTSKGIPVSGLQVILYKLLDGRWTLLNEANTSPTGHCMDLVGNAKSSFTPGRYKMHFDVDKYFSMKRIESMFPFIEIVFDVKNPTGVYHIPILLSPFGYTTYRGVDKQ